VKIHLYHLTIAAIASHIPVLPDVHSMIVAHGFNIPDCSASSIIFRAILSLIEFQGLNVSIFANIVAGISLVMLLILTNGV